MTAYYNENDPCAACVLRELIAEGQIAPGHVDDRSIKDVTADDLRGFTQVHWFAGMGGWSFAVRRAGWPDSRPLWSASCPCQPFSAAGKGAGTDDPRHLWPDLFRIIRDARARGFGPRAIVGEQVSGAPGYGWFDGVRADLATEGYACGVRDIPACAVDAPHQRNRLYWVGLGDSVRQPTQRDARGIPGPKAPVSGAWEQDGRQSYGLRDADDSNCHMEHGAGLGWREGRPEHEFWSGRATSAGADGAGALGDVLGTGLEGHAGHGDGSRGSIATRPATETDGRCGSLHADADCGGRDGWPEDKERVAIGRAAPEWDMPRRNGSFWSDAEWIVCHDGKARRAKPGVRLLVDGMAGRIDLWRLAGNGIVLDLAAEAIAALAEVITGPNLANQDQP